MKQGIFIVCILLIAVILIKCNSTNKNILISVQNESNINRVDIVYLNKKD